MAVNFPSDESRTAVIGSTGSGKTQFAVWLLSTRDFDNRPWIIFDFKTDSLISEIGAIEISVKSKPPVLPGLYVVRPIPEADDAYVTAMLWAIWENQYTGIYIDEGYMIGNRNAALVACLTQGRSRKIEMIILSQRPAWLSRFVFSESNYYAVFNLTMEDDRKTIRTFAPMVENRLLPKYNCQWYDVDRQQASLFKPVPSKAVILDRFRKRLKEMELEKVRKI